MAGDEVNVTDPLGATQPVRVTAVDGSTVGLITPETPGVYRVTADSGQEGAAVAANVDTVESDIRGTDLVSLRRWLGDVPVEVVSEGLADLALNSRTGRDPEPAAARAWHHLFLHAGAFCQSSVTSQT